MDDRKCSGEPHRTRAQECVGTIDRTRIGHTGNDRVTRVENEMQIASLSFRRDGTRRALAQERRPGHTPKSVQKRISHLTRCARFAKARVSVAFQNALDRPNRSQRRAEIPRFQKIATLFVGRRPPERTLTPPISSTTAGAAAGAGSQSRFTLKAHRRLDSSKSSKSTILFFFFY